MGLIISCASSIGACVILSIIYVASLYIWKSPHSRDHPLTIKRRFVSVIVMTVISPLFLWICLSKDSLTRASLFEQMGIRFAGIIQALVLPLFLTMVLYLGPLSISAFSGMWKIYAEPMYWWNSVGDLIWVRNHVVAPLSEEFTFRACMMPLLLECLPPIPAIIVCPFVFGIAHFHHMIERLRSGWDPIFTLKISCFQFVYTTLFGAYSAFLFARTGHFAAPLIAHAFCNHMGLPSFSDVLLYEPMQRLIIVILYVAGLIAWCLLLNPITTPSFYHNTIHWNQE